jgi:hypothetical protein
MYMDMLASPEKTVIPCCGDAKDYTSAVAECNCFVQGRERETGRGDDSQVV